MAALTGDAAPAVPSRLGMATGVFALIWAVVVVLMIVRPGSTTGVGRDRGIGGWLALRALPDPTS
jgi:hypothetical protein